MTDHDQLDPTALDARLAFIGGLHRSGTTPLTHWLAEHPKVSSFSDTGVWEDEGQHLQDAYPTASAHGGPGRFVRDRRAHLTECSPLASTATRDRLTAAWAPHWDHSCPVLLEKSPPNLIRTRFLQSLFPRARFIIAIRHPIAVAYATKKWTRSTTMASLIEHWLTAHELLLADAATVDRLTIVRYEDLIATPTAELARLYAFLGLESIERDWDADPGRNESYIARWEAGTSPVRRTWRRRLAATFEDRVAPFGYSLASPRRLTDPIAEIARYRPAARAVEASLSAS